MANRFNGEYREPHNGGYVGGNYDLSPGDQQELAWLKWRRDNPPTFPTPWSEENPHGPTNPPEPTGGVRVPRTPSPIRPAGGMSLPIPTKAGTW